MAFQPVPNTAQVEMVYDLFGSKVENVYHVRGSGGWTIAELQSLANVFNTWDNDVLKLMRGASACLDRIVARDLTAEIAPGVEVNAHIDPCGSGGGETQPGNVTVAVKWTTGLVGRSARGRTYHIGLTETMTVGNALVPTIAANLITAYTSLITRIQGADPNWQLVVVSRYSNNVRRAQGEVFDIIACDVDLNLDSQRRRLTGRGQ